MTFGSMCRRMMRAVAEAGGARGIHVGHLARRERARAHHARAARHHRRGDGEDHVARAGAEDRDHREGEDDHGKREEHVHHALHDEVHLGRRNRRCRPRSASRASRRSARRPSRPSARFCEPKMMRESTSRPKASVPSQCAALGAASIAAIVVGERVVGRDPAAPSAATAVRTMIAGADRAERPLPENLAIAETQPRGRLAIRVSSSTVCGAAAMLSGSGCADRSTRRRCRPGN